MDDKTFQVVDMRLSICIFDSKLLWEWDPIIKFLLHESLWVDSESLKVNEKNFWIVANDYLFGCYLTCHASFTHLRIDPAQKKWLGLTHHFKRRQCCYGCHPCYYYYLLSKPLGNLRVLYPSAN